MSDPRPHEVDPDALGDEEVDVDEETAGRPPTEAEEQGITDEQAEALKDLGEDPRSV